MSSNMDGRVTQKITDSCRPSTIQDAYEYMRMQDASKLRSLIKEGSRSIEPDIRQIISNEITCSLIQVCVITCFFQCILYIWHKTDKTMSALF